MPKKPAQKKPAPKKGGYSGSEKTANWPGLPGKKQPKDRGQGIPKIKNAMMDDF